MTNAIKMLLQMQSGFLQLESTLGIFGLSQDIVLVNVWLSFINCQILRETGSVGRDGKNISEELSKYFN
jgi:hypothetical protein